MRKRKRCEKKNVLDYEIWNLVQVKNFLLHNINIFLLKIIVNSTTQHKAFLLPKIFTEASYKVNNILQN